METRQEEKEGEKEDRREEQKEEQMGSWKIRAQPFSEIK